MTETNGGRAVRVKPAWHENRRLPASPIPAGIPGWWKGRPMTSLRLSTILMNIRKEAR